MICRGCSRLTLHQAHEPTLSSFLNDASLLVSSFADGLDESAPHIYVSMLPLTQIDSVVAAHYCKMMSSMIRVERKETKPKERLLSTPCFSRPLRCRFASSSRCSKRWPRTTQCQTFCHPPTLGKKVSDSQDNAMLHFREESVTDRGRSNVSNV